MIVSGYRGTRLIKNPGARRIPLLSDPWLTHANSPSGFSFDVTNSGRWFSYFSSLLNDGVIYIFPFYWALDADDADARNGLYQFWAAPNGLVGAPGFYFNFVSRPIVFDKIRDADFSDWKSEN